MSINSRDKGCNFERDVSWFVSLWWWGTPRAISRTPMSGGWHKTIAAGDLISEVDPMPLSIECKCAQDWHYGELFNKGWSTLGGYWEQCVGDASHQQKHPMLVFKSNGTPVYVMMEKSSLPFLTPQHNRIFTTDPRGVEVVILKMKEDLFHLPLQQVYESLMSKELDIYPYEMFLKLRAKTREKLPPKAGDLPEIAKVKFPIQ